MRSRLPPALRGLLRSWRLSLAAVACLAVGSAAVASMATLIRCTLLQPLPFPDADRLVRVWGETEETERVELSYPLVRRIQEDVGGLDAFVATVRARLLFFGNGPGRRVEGEGVSPGYFELLGVRPEVGRLFAPEEYAPGHEGVMVISHALWESRFAFDPEVVGRTISTAGGVFEVIGVLPTSFGGTVEEDAGEIEFWLPIEHYLDAERRSRWSRVPIWGIGLRSPGTSSTALAAELAELAQRLAGEQPEIFREQTLHVEPLGENWRSGLRRGSWLLLGAALALLLISTLNVAALLLARSLEQARERALRRALGAPGRRVVLAALGETVLLVVVGGGLGALLARGLLPWVLAQAVVQLPVYVDPRPDLVSLAAVVGFLGLAALGAALAPALSSLGADPAEALREGGRGGSRSRSAERVWTALVASEVALALVLAFGALVLIRSYEELAGADLGFDTDKTLRIGFFVGPEDASTPADRWRLAVRAREEIGRQPGVEQVALTWPTVPMWGAIRTPLRWGGMPGELQEPGLPVEYFMVDQGFFEVLAIQLLAGRSFGPGDEVPGSGPVAMVTRGLAERLGGLDEAIGKELELAGGAARVVGVVEDAFLSGSRHREREILFLPLRGNPVSPDPPSYVTVLVAARERPGNLLRPLEELLGELAPQSALDWVGTFEDELAQQLRDVRFAPLLLGIFAAAAMLVSGVGLLALTSAGVARRRSEIGVRKAFGATPARIARRVVGRAVVVAGFGVGAGLAASWLAARVLESFVYGVSVRDPFSLVLAAALLLAAAAVAAWHPALAAARTDAMVVLREEG